MTDIYQLNIKRNSRLYKQWIELLGKASIRHEDNVEKVFGVYDGESLVATGAIYQNILKCIAVCKDYTGGPVFNQLISHMMSEVLNAGFSSVYVYTTSKAVNSFQYLGFNEVARVGNDLVFLEKAVHGFNEYLENLKTYTKDNVQTSSIVMNANPFTIGHQYLVEYASKHSERVFVFVLSEDISEFPKDVRLELVKEGTAHLNNVTVLETGSYMVSSQTFPSYFLKEDVNTTAMHASLDATIFKKIAKTIGITKRFLGEEPFSEATAIYNKALTDVLGSDVEIEIIPRLESQNIAVSASRVRKELLENNMDQVRLIVPPTTLKYLESDDGRLLIEKIRNGG